MRKKCTIMNISKSVAITSQNHFISELLNIDYDFDIGILQTENVCSKQRLGSNLSIKTNYFSDRFILRVDLNHHGVHRNIVVS